MKKGAEQEEHHRRPLVRKVAKEQQQMMVKNLHVFDTILIFRIPTGRTNVPYLRVGMG